MSTKMGNRMRFGLSTAAVLPLAGLLLTGDAAAQQAPAQDPKATPPTWGRPVDLLQLKDGSILVSDDFNGIIYRISYKK